MPRLRTEFRKTAAMSSAVQTPQENRSALLNALSREMKLRHYSDRTIRSYARWVVRYIRFHGTRHPSRLGQAEVVQFLSTLAVRDRVSASTQNEAMPAISFLSREVLRAPLGELEPIARAKRPVRIPVVLTKAEVGSLIAQM